MQSKPEISFYFPGFTRKSLTFTIDDGNITNDTKFLSIVRPAGILGTFNLCEPKWLTPDEYREMYRGYEIANHVKHHPEAFKDGFVYKVSCEPLDRATSDLYRPDNPVIYKTDIDDLFIFNDCKTDRRPGGWSHIVSTETYLKLVSECHQALESVFGVGSIKGFVWPYSEQKCTELVKAVKGLGYASVRKTGEVGSLTGFALPADRMAWSYNAATRNLLKYMEEYASYPDTGELKFFAFGVHSYDFESLGLWGDLEAVAEKYGNRPSEFYYATVSDIFEYEDAVKALRIEERTLINDSERDVYLSVDGKKIVIPKKTRIEI